MTPAKNEPWSRRDALRACGAVAVAALAGRAARALADSPPAAPAKAAGKLTPEQQKQLEAAKYVYISSTRKDGTLGSPAEIWFAVMDGAVWVGSSPDSWRAKRIRWGRPQAKIAIGSPQGPSFRATGAFVKDPALYTKFCDQLGVKYPERWARWENSFRDGLASGERVLIRYSPVAA
ncbi:MAG: hypothetical protein AB1689_10535 [Thermodesulfobacteriota bacterium]